MVGNFCVCLYKIDCFYYILVVNGILCVMFNEFDKVEKVFNEFLGCDEMLLFELFVNIIKLN